jgi:hypothetical protein
MDNQHTTLTLREYPIVQWIVGGILVSTAIFVYLSAPEGSIFLPTIDGLVGLGFLLVPTVLTVTADLGDQTLTLHYQAPFRGSEKQVRIPDIVAIRLETSHDSDSGSTYRLVIDCVGGQVIPFRSYYSSGRTGKLKKVERLRAFLGLVDLAGPQPAMPTVDMLGMGEPARTGSSELEQIKDGIHWKLQTISHAGSTITRCFSPDFKCPSGFLFLAQKATGQKTIAGKMVDGISKFLFQQSLRLYGFEPEDLPGLESADVLAPLDSRLEPCFMAFTSDSAAARQIMNPWVSTPLAEWADRSPLKGLQVQGYFGQLVVLFSPQGVYVANLGAMTPDAMEELTDLGVSLVKAVR